MSLQAVPVIIERERAYEDGYGGVTTVSAGTAQPAQQVYTGLTATVNYPSRTPDLRAESGSGRAVGPGVATRYLGLVTFEPRPSLALLAINDIVYVPSTGERHRIVGIRDRYEFTLQLDVERLV